MKNNSNTSECVYITFILGDFCFTSFVLTSMWTVKPKKRTYQFVDFAVPMDHREKINTSKKMGKYLDLAREPKKAMGHLGVSDTNCNRYTRNGSERLGKGIRRMGNQEKNRDHPDYNIVEIDQNTRKRLLRLQ